MQIYTLRIRYSRRNGEVYDISEEIEDEEMHFQVNDTDLVDLIDEEDMIEEMQMGSTDIALT
jgi:hypothetical protein|tara:strand:+ start:359 stop:544 length:186 start_codon:yes stop_codon:yes gene_type:complete